MPLPSTEAFSVWQTAVLIVWPIGAGVLIFQVEGIEGITHQGPS